MLPANHYGFVKQTFLQSFTWVGFYWAWTLDVLHWGHQSVLRDLWQTPAAFIKNDSQFCELTIDVILCPCVFFRGPIQHGGLPFGSL